MKSKESYFSFSTAIIRENFRRFWAVSALSFCFYFLSGIFPILMSYRNLDYLAGYIESCLQGLQPFFFMANFMTPVITAVLVFKYLQSVNSTTYMNALPVSRARLYNSNVLSGFLLAIVPMILAGLIMLIIAKPVYYDYSYMAVAQNVFSRVDILGWMLDSFVIILFVYAVSILAGMVTSNSIIHLCIALFFNFLIPSLYGAVILYSNHFLTGYTTVSEVADLWLNFTPVIKIFTGIGLLHMFWYVLISFGLIALSSLCYHKRRMENAGNSMAFGFMVPVIAYLGTFFGMSLMGAYFHTLGGELYMYFGFAVGAILFFLVGMMILLRTPKVFTKRSLKSFLVYAVIGTMFVSCFALDLTGFEKRVPDVNKVNSSQISTDFLTVNSWGDRYLTRYYAKPDADGSYSDMVFKDKENIEAIIAMHEDIVKLFNFDIIDYNNMNYSYIGSYRGPYIGPTKSLLLRYDTGGLFNMTRQYNVSSQYVMESPYAKQLFESKEFKDFFSFDNLRYVKITSMALSSDGVDTVNFKDLGLGADDMAALLDAMEKDFQDRTFEEHTDLTHAVARMEMEFLSIDSLDGQGNPSQEYMNAEILASDTNTIAWLTEIGYMADLAAADANVSKITVTRYSRESHNIGEAPTAAEFLGIQTTEDYAVTESTVTITDKTEIAKILSSYQNGNLDSTEYYMVDIYYPAYQTDISYDNDRYYENDYEYKQKYSGGEDYSISTGYYDLNTVPDFIKAKFETENQ